MAKGQTQQATKQANQLFTGTPSQIQQVSGLGGPAGSPPAPGTTLATQQQAQQLASQTGSEAKTGYENMQTTGGYDPSQLAGMRSNAQQFTDTGGYDPTQFANLTSTFGNLATTGGFNPQQETDFINAETEGVGATYDVLMAQQQRQRAAQGLGAGGGEYAQMAEEMGAAQADAALKARMGLQSLETQNKTAGLQGLSSIADRRLQGFGQQTGLESGVAAGSRAGTAGLESIFDTSSGQVTALGNQLLNSLGLQFNTQEEANAFMAQLAKTPGLFQTVFGDVTSLISAAGGGKGIRTGVTGG